MGMKIAADHLGNPSALAPKTIPVSPTVIAVIPSVNLLLGGLFGCVIFLPPQYQSKTVVLRVLIALLVLAQYFNRGS